MSFKMKEAIKTLEREFEILSVAPTLSKTLIGTDIKLESLNKVLLSAEDDEDMEDDDFIDLDDDFEDDDDDFEDDDFDDDELEDFELEDFDDFDDVDDEDEYFDDEEE